MSGRLRVIGLIFFAVSTASSFGQGEQDLLRQPFIINGIPTDAFPAVGIVGEASVGGFCTGTLIGPQHVLTAAHCAQAILDVGSEDSGTFEVGGRIYRTVAVEIFPTYNDQLFTDDVAVLVLADPVEDIEPMLISDVPPEIGEMVTIVGFGGQGTAEDGSDGSFGSKAVGMVAVDRVNDTEFSWDFDDPDESNPAPGDSGGPVLIDAGDTLLIAGIVSSGTVSNAGLRDTNFNMRVDAYGDWIVDTVLTTQSVADEAAADEPSEETPTESDDENEPDAEDAAPEETTSSEQVDGSTDSGEDCSSGNRRRHGGRQRGRRKGTQNCDDDESCSKPCDPTPTCPAEDSATTNDESLETPEVEATPADDTSATDESPATETQPVGESPFDDTPSTESAGPSLPDDTSDDGELDVPAEQESATEITADSSELGTARRRNRFDYRRPRGSFRDATRYYRYSDRKQSSRKINVRR